MQELAESGAKVLNAQAVEFAKDRGIAIYARATAGGDGETVVRKLPPRAPGRVVGVASEKGLVLLATRRRRSRRWKPCSSTSTGAACRGKELLVREPGGRLRSWSPSRTLHGFPALRETLVGRFARRGDDPASSSAPSR